MDTGINEFQQIMVMVPNISQKRITIFFIEGLMDKLKALVKVHRPNSLDDAIGLALDLDVTPSNQPPKKHFSPWKTERKVLISQITVLIS